MPAHDYGNRHKDRMYHGIQAGPETTGRAVDPGRLLVERTETGPTERQSVRVLREVPEFRHDALTWGYDGGGPSATAAAILARALNLDSDLVYGSRADETFVELREDFVEDFLAVACDEFRLRRRAALFPVKSAC